MIKLIAVEPKGDCKLLLLFSDGTWGVYDFAHYAEASTPMTEPLQDTDYFGQYFIEPGALAWPNGFDLSAESLQSVVNGRINWVIPKDCCDFDFRSGDEAGVISQPSLAL